MKYFLALDLPGHLNQFVKTAKTSNPKGNDRTPVNQQVKYKHILNGYQVKERCFHIVRIFSLKILFSLSRPTLFLLF